MTIVKICVAVFAIAAVAGGSLYAVHERRQPASAFIECAKAASCTAIWTAPQQQEADPFFRSAPQPETGNRRF